MATATLEKGTKLVTGNVKIGGLQKALEKAARNVVNLAAKSEDATAFQAKFDLENEIMAKELEARRMWAATFAQRKATSEGEYDGQGKRFSGNTVDTSFEQNMTAFAEIVSLSRVPVAG